MLKFFFKLNFFIFFFCNSSWWRDRFRFIYRDVRHGRRDPVALQLPFLFKRKFPWSSLNTDKTPPVVSVELPGALGFSLNRLGAPWWGLVDRLLRVMGLGPGSNSPAACRSTSNSTETWRGRGAKREQGYLFPNDPKSGGHTNCQHTSASLPRVCFSPCGLISALSLLSGGWRYFPLSSQLVS